MPRTAVKTANSRPHASPAFSGLYISSSPADSAVAAVREPKAAKPLAARSLNKREELFREMQPLVRRLIQRFGEDAEMRRDLEGEIYYRFCLLLDAFDPERGVPLRPYLIRQLTASVYTY